MAHLRAVPDPDDDSHVAAGDEADTASRLLDDPALDPVDPAAAVAPGEDDAPVVSPEDDLTALPDDEVRRYPSTIGGAFYLSILAAAGTALVIAARSDWRLGVEILGGSLLVAALLRLVLATRDAGMLAVRHRFVDVSLLTATGVALIFLASSIPDMPVG